MSSPDVENEARHEGEDDTSWRARVKRIRKDQTLAVLETLGFDVDDIGEIQKDIMFLRKLRTASETAGSKAFAAAISAFFAIVGALGVLAFQHFTGQK